MKDNKQPKRKQGRQPGSYKLKEMTDEQYKQVELMAGLGLSLDQIAGLLKVSPATVDEMKKRDERFNQAIVEGRANAIGKVAGTAYRMAVSGERPDMTRFYLRCRAGWSEKIAIEQNIKHEIVFKTKIGDEGEIKLTSDDKDILALDGLDL